MHGLRTKWWNLILNNGHIKDSCCLEWHISAWSRFPIIQRAQGASKPNHSMILGFYDSTILETGWGAAPQRKEQQPWGQQTAQEPVEHLATTTATASSAIVARGHPPGRGKRSFPSVWHLWGHMWSTLSSFGPPKYIRDIGENPD